MNNLQFLLTWFDQFQGHVVVSCEENEVPMWTQIQRRTLAPADKGENWRRTVARRID